jgi:site-specific DNA recombinase
MIAEYERAQIAERCRRGKKHMAQQGGVNVLSGAPYGYRHIRESDSSAAFYEAIETVEAEVKVVRMVFEIYTQQGLSINAIARLLNERRIATRTGKGRWERSTVWGMLRNPGIEAPLAMARRNSGPGARRALSVNGRPCPVATLVGMNGRTRSGLKSQCRRW